MIEIDGQEAALFQVQGCAYAIANRCPHRGAPLWRGQVEVIAATQTAQESVAVRCPLHGWLFDLKSGRCLNQPEVSTRVYPVPGGVPNGSA